jgi:class 3 adenylate cyclase
VATDVAGEPAMDGAAAAEGAPPRPQELPTEATGAAAAPRRRRLRWPKLGIQSKLLIMLLATSIISCVVVGIVGYRSGRDALREKAFEQLTFVRNSRARGITREYNRLVSNLLVFTKGQTAIQAVEAYHEGFHELEDSTLTAEKESDLDAYYSDVFVPGLDRNLGTTSLPDVFIPTSPAQRYLQAWYTAPYDNFDDAIAVTDAGDGSAWSEAHTQYHRFFQELVSRYGYEDVMLIDEEGNVVYSAYKGVDLGTNVLDGPYDGTNLRTSFEQAIESNSVDFVSISDLERYQPSYGIPTGWAVSPIGDEGEIFGVIALQLSIANINAVMTGNEDWVDDGLGDTGETYLVGQDGLMRSTSRLVVEAPEAYESEAIEGGTPPEVAARAARVGGTILIQPVETPQVERAQRGDTGELIADDYLGNEVLAAYTPVELGDLGWVVIAEIDTSEAFEPVNDFTRRLVLATAGIIVAVALASLLLAQIFSRPVKRLMVGVRKVAAGDLGAQVATSSTDEFADLAGAFNEMSRSLQTKQELLEHEQQEHQRLLLTIMPPTVAKRYREGEQTISEDHQDVAVVFADIVGFDDYASGLDSATSLAELNELFRQFDEAAERVGVERVRTSRSGYLASCGLLMPRVDNALRALDFTREMDSIVQRYNSTRGTSLWLRAGIDAGKVTSGLVGRSSMLYDLWGDAVNLAFRVQGAIAQPGVFVTQRVYDRLRDAATFEPAGTIDTSSGSQQVWRLVP